MFSSPMIDTLATPRAGAMEVAIGPGVVDGGGMEATGWATAALVVTDGIGLPLVAMLATTYTTFDDGGTLIREGTA